MTKPSIAQLRVALVLSLCVLCAGCKDLLVYQNYARVRQDASTHAHVEQLLGRPDMKVAGCWRYDRPEKHLTAIVDFDESGRVTRKQWIDGTNGIWEDSRDADD